MTNNHFSREELLSIIETDHLQYGEASMLARMALSAMDSESGCLPLDYLQGHKDGLEWAAQLAEANHPETGDWLYDDPIELAKAIRKGPDMPPVQPVADSEPAIADCDPEVYEKGVSVCLVAIPKETAEVICQNITAATGCKVDWHYFGGRVHIKALRVTSQPAPVVNGEYGDAYQGAREDLAIWKRRALEAEESVRRLEQINDHLVKEAQGESRMGEPVIAQPAPVVPVGIEHLRSIVADPRLLPRRKEWIGGQQYSYVLLEEVEAIVDEACRAAMLQELKKSAGTEAICRSDENVQVLHTKSPAQSDCCPAQNHVFPAQNVVSPAQSPIDHGYQPECECSGCKATARICTEMAVNSLVIPNEMTSEQAYEIGYYYGDPVDVFARGANWMRQHIIDSTLAAAPQSPGSEPATVPGKWIPVSERMPESNGMYFGWDGKRVLEVYCFFGGFSANQFIHGEITHWMPLPAAPQEVR